VASKKKASLPFWKRKKLTEMTSAEWESICDGCGRCCLNKIEEPGPNPRRVDFTDVACKLFDDKTCRCIDYKNRKAKVPDCVQLTPRILPKMFCLPPTCGYRRLYEGKDLPWWHHLRSGSRETVHEVGISARGKTVSEEYIRDEDIETRIVKWPLSQRTTVVRRR
jgi:uncharacterized cysteine cluster protein YcgN (CxxCxxCC family)